MSSSSLAAGPCRPAWPFRSALLTDAELQALLWPASEEGDGGSPQGAEVRTDVPAGQRLDGRLS